MDSGLVLGMLKGLVQTEISQKKLYEFLERLVRIPLLLWQLFIWHQALYNLNIYLIEIAKIWHRYPLCQECGGHTKVIMRLAVGVLSEISQHLWGGLS